MSSPPSPSAGSPHPALSELFHAASRRLRRRRRAQLAPYGLSPHQFRALSTLGGGGGEGGADGAGMRLKDLAERLRIAPRSATEVVDQLQHLGLVERRPDPGDRRAVRIVLTPTGADRTERIRADWHDQADDFFAVLDDEDRTELTRLLRLLGSEDDECR